MANGIRNKKAVLKAIELIQQLTWDDMCDIDCYEIYKSLLKNIGMPFEPPIFTDCIDRSKVVAFLIANIDSGLNWKNTPQGFSFWADAYNALRDSCNC